VRVKLSDRKRKKWEEAKVIILTRLKWAKEAKSKFI
jgi:hypothetical protein